MSITFQPTTRRSRVVEDLKQPNGIISAGRQDMRADIGAGKTWLSHQPVAPLLRKLFCELGSDRMTIDNRKCLWARVSVSIPLEKIEQIDVLEPWTANVCFGGKDGRLLFITASRTSTACGCRFKASIANEEF